MSGGDFIDSSVLVYLVDGSSPTKSGVAQTIVLAAVADGTASISFQVVQETLNVITGKFASTATPEGTERLMGRVLDPLWKVMPSRELYRRCLEIKNRYRYSFYDSLIIAAALEDGCTRLLSEDLQHGQRIEGMVITNPFQ
jgi:predicted nucleic acid-binding protein